MGLSEMSRGQLVATMSVAAPSAGCNPRFDK